MRVESTRDWARCRVSSGGPSHLAGEVEGGEQLVLGLHQLRRVDFEQGLAAAYFLAHVVDVDLFYPARVLGGHRHHALLVVLQITDGADGTPQVLAGDGGGAHVHVLHHGGIDAHHAVAVAGGPRGLGAHGRQVHAANGALAGTVLHHLGMHAARPQAVVFGGTMVVVGVVMTGVGVLAGCRGDFAGLISEGRQPLGGQESHAGRHQESDDLQQGTTGGRGWGGHGEVSSVGAVTGPPAACSRRVQAMARSARVRAAATWTSKSTTSASSRSMALSLPVL